MRHGTTGRSLVLMGVLSALSPLGIADATDSGPAVQPLSAAGGERASTPDLVAEYAGGLAARLHVAGNDPIPGEVYLLIATDGSDEAARVYDRTPFRHDGGAHENTRDSNLAALEFVEDITGEDLEPLDLTSAPGGGGSGGVAYAIGYLDVVSGGRFTAGLRVAALFPADLRVAALRGLDLLQGSDDHNHPPRGRSIEKQDIQRRRVGAHLGTLSSSTWGARPG